MSYLCGCCEGAVKGPRQVHTFYREVDGPKKLINSKYIDTKRKEIEREVPICGSCKSALLNGVDFNKLRAECQLKRRREEEDRKLARQEEKNRQTVERINQKIRQKPLLVEGRPKDSKPIFDGEVVKYKDIKKPRKEGTND